MAYAPSNISITHALKLLKARGAQFPEQALLESLREGQVTASGLVDGTWRQLESVWWRHINSPFDDENDNTVWFDRKLTQPPTPFRAERIEVSKAIIDGLWPEIVLSETLPPATMQELLKWAGDRWPNGDLPGRGPLLAEARNEFSGVTEGDCRELRRKLASDKSKIGGAPSHKKKRSTK